jgi:hypothetical protein
VGEYCAVTNENKEKMGDVQEVSGELLETVPRE